MDENFENFVTLLHFCHEDDAVPATATRKLVDVGLLCDKYRFRGQLPEWCFHELDTRACTFLSASYNKAWWIDLLQSHSPLSWDSFPRVLEAAYYLNMPKIFAKASRALMWSVSCTDIEKCLSPDLIARIPADTEEIFSMFKEEALRLRKDLVLRLPTVFHPASHKEPEKTIGPCGNCASLTNEERWYREVISKNRAFRREQETGKPAKDLETLFKGYLADLEKLCQLRSQSGVAPGDPLQCPRYWPTHLDGGSEQQLMFELYTAIGGLCLWCVKSGEIKYGKSCTKHNLDLYC